MSDSLNFGNWIFIILGVYVTLCILFEVILPIVDWWYDKKR